MGIYVILNKLYLWWSNLKWEDKSYDKVKGGTLFERETPLGIKALFFRDRLAVIGNFGTSVLILIIVIKTIFF